MDRFFDILRLGLFFVVAMTAAHGQELPFVIKEGTAPPAPPLISRPLEGTQWIIKFTRLGATSGTPESGNWTGSVQANAYSEGILRRTVEYGGKAQPSIYYTNAEMLYIDGAGHVKVQNSEDELGFPAPKPGHFSELQWISPEKYVGETDYKGQKCDVYQEYFSSKNTKGRKTSPAEPDDEKIRRDVDLGGSGVPFAQVTDEPKARMKRTALVGRKTKLPIALVESGTLWIYTFLPERRPFVLPPGYAEALAVFRKENVDLRQKYRVSQ